MNEESSHENLPAEASADGAPSDNDSLLTAYALGELNDGERAEIEARLRESADDRQRVDDIRRLGKLFRAALTESPSSARTPELREAMLAEMTNPPHADSPLQLPERFPRRRFWLPLSLAAALLVTCGALFGLMGTKHGERPVAQRELHEESLANDEARSRATVANLADTDAVESLDTEDGESLATLSEGLGGDSSVDAEMSLAPPLGLTDLSLESQADEVARGSRTRTTSSAALSGRFGGATTDVKRRGTATERFGEPASADRPQGRQTINGSADGLLYGGRGLPEPGEGLAESKESGGTKAPRNRRPRLESERGRRPQETKPESFGMHMGGMGTGGAASQAGPNPGAAMGGMMGGGMMPANKSRGGESGERKGEAESRDNVYLYRVGSAEAVPDAASRPSQPAQAPLFINGVRLEGYAGYGGIALANDESYPPLVENEFRKPADHPLSTFSIDVDTASYTNVRRFLNSRAMPPRDAVRIEELINYFQYSYPQPDGDVPFSITTDVADCPWNAEHRLLRVGLKGRDVPADQRPASNLVFLLDVSGSMEAPNKLPLVKEAMYLLVDKLTENDRVAIVVYAGNSGLALPPTNGENKATIRTAISQLVASGSTNGGQGLQMAYETALTHFIKDGTNRVILATDGDFNVGIVDQNELVQLIEDKAKSGVFLSALGFGIGNLKDGTLEKLADKGNGNYAYIDTLSEARRVLVEQLSGTLVTIAKDVKLQIEFNPAQATEYRLIGYEDRLMPPQDFHDDRKDAGEIGAGHSVTALYEIVPAPRGEPSGEPLKYQRSENLTPAAATGELATIKLRYKQPDGETSRLIEHVVSDRRPQQAEASRDMSFAAAVAAFGMLLRDSPYRGDATYQKVLSLAEQGLSSDPNGYRSEFVQLVRQARDISGKE